MTVIVTESLSCMTPELCRTNNTHLIPIDCFINGKRYSDRITNAVPPPKDSYSLPPTKEAYARVFKRFTDSGQNVLCITVSKRMSSSYMSAVGAAEGYSPDRVRVIDSGTVAGGLYLIVKYVRETFDDDTPLDVIADAVIKYKTGIRASFTTENSDRLIAYNRLGSNVEHRRPILNQKPIFFIEDGSITHKTSASPGFREISELVSVLNNPRYVVLHYLEKDSYLREVGNAIKQKCPNSKIYTVPITLSLKINLGTSIIGVIGD